METTSKNFITIQTLKKEIEMEMYYGDQTLQELMDHAQSFNEQLETFEFIYSLTEFDEAEDTEEETGQIGKEETDPA